jgi:hypothetical protein
MYLTQDIRMATTNDVAISAQESHNGSPVAGIDTIRTFHSAWLADGHPPDFQWVTNGNFMYANTLASVPDVFAWKDSKNILTSVGILEHSVCVRRLQSYFDHIHRFVPSLAASMRDCFDALPPKGRARFMMAPETVYRISRLRKDPTTSIVCLCNSLNAESAMYGDAVTNSKGYWTALGDFYYPGANREYLPIREHDISWDPDHPFRAPRLAQTIPVDFFSPHIASANPKIEGLADYMEFSPGERVLVYQRLEDALRAITEVSEAVGLLIRDFVKVIVPLKATQIGSTSQPPYPGRVLLRGVEQYSRERLAAALVHEAIHQFLYIVEYAGQFAVNDADTKANVRITSLWTGRQLPLHSFFHACFVWYGLATFWGLAQSSNVFDPAAVDRELSKCLSGFRDQNPTDMLGPHAGLVRHEAKVVASALHGRLQSLLSRTAA